MKPKEQQRALVLAGVLDGRYTSEEAAPVLELSPRQIRRFLMAPLPLPVEDEPGAPQLADNVISLEAGEPAHQGSVTGMRTSPLAAGMSRSAGGNSPPCSR